MQWNLLIEAEAFCCHVPSTTKPRLVPSLVSQVSQLWATLRKTCISCRGILSSCLKPNAFMRSTSIDISSSVTSNLPCIVQWSYLLCIADYKGISLPRNDIWSFRIHRLQMPWFVKQPLKCQYMLMVDICAQFLGELEFIPSGCLLTLNWLEDVNHAFQ